MAKIKTLTTTTIVLWPLFRDHPGEPEPEEKLLDFMVQGKINRGRHIDHPDGRHSIRTKQCPPLPSPIFYRPDALPAAQPTVSKQIKTLRLAPLIQWVIFQRKNMPSIKNNI